METQKVKEIKKGLECCSTLMDNNAISEERDNSCNECPYRLNDRCSWNLDKDALALINELEKGNEALSFAVKQGFNDCQAKTLKQFAERLKEEFDYQVSKYGDCNGNECANVIDETLKEWVCDKYQ